MVTYINACGILNGLEDENLNSEHRSLFSGCKMSPVHILRVNEAIIS